MLSMRSLYAVYALVMCCLCAGSKGKKLDKMGWNRLETVSKASRNHLEGMRGYAPLNENYFLRLYVYTSYADSKRSVSDRWLTNDK